jgi:hypothetical protein
MRTRLVLTATLLTAAVLGGCTTDTEASAPGTTHNSSTSSVGSAHPTSRGITTSSVSATPATTAQRVWADCGQVGFRDASDDVASDIRAEGTSCADAIALVGKVRQQHSFLYGPRRFTIDEFACSVSVDETYLPSGVYDCESDTARITWLET